jgi:hypothetical protein
MPLIVSLRLREIVSLGTDQEGGDEGSYRGDEPWPGRIRFVPFDELPLRP